MLVCVKKGERKWEGGIEREKEGVRVAESESWKERERKKQSGGKHDKKSLNEYVCERNMSSVMNS